MLAVTASGYRQRVVFDTPTPHPGVTLSEVPPQPAAVAHRCPVRSDLDHDPAVAHLKASLDPSEKQRRLDTALHVSQIWARVADAAKHSVGSHRLIAIDAAAARSEQVEATRRAIESSALIIVGARLPDDVVGRRRGRSILLVRSSTGADHSSGWVPVEVRRHAYVRPANGGEMSTSPLDHPFPDEAVTVSDVAARSPRYNENGLALAHAWRLLEAIGAVSTNQRPRGGLVDRDGNLWWLDLLAPQSHTRWSPTPVSMLDHYDHGFSFRLEVIANRLARNRDPSIARGVVPVHIGQCTTCPWKRVCLDELEAIDHVSLIPRSTFDHFRAHQNRGVFTRTQVAALHWPTAWLMFGDNPRQPETDLLGFLSETADLPETTPLIDLFPTDDDLTSAPASVTTAHETAVQLQFTLDDDDSVPGRDPDGELLSPPLDPPPDDPRHAEDQRRRSVLGRRLDELGLTTVGDLDQIDLKTASYGGSNCGHLPTVIDEARAAVAGQPFLARGVQHPRIRRADVEVDIDMENIETGVYLWGTLTSASPSAVSAIDPATGYRPFYSWDPMSPAVQAGVLERFWGWLTDLRAQCNNSGLTFAAYCYTTAEHRKMLQIIDEANGDIAVSPAEVDALVRSSEWVDLYDVVRQSLVVGHGLGLKRIAPLAGFSWRDDDAGGLQSMGWYRQALEDPDPAMRALNRQRLLAYNEDDVRATLAVRRWLSTAEITPISTLEHTPKPT